MAAGRGMEKPSLEADPVLPPQLLWIQCLLLIDPARATPPWRGQIQRRCSLLPLAVPFLLR